MDTRDAWENEYRRRGRLWGGAPQVPALPPDARILELGCGDGRTAALLARAGHAVTAIDFSSDAARLCRNRCKSSGRAEVLAADCRLLPFRDRSFDAIIAFHVTGHLPEDGRRLLAGGIARLLAPGGTLYFREFSRGDFRYGRGTQAERGTFVRNNGIATHYFDAGEVRDLFSCLLLRSLDEHRREMRIRGENYPRAEIVAEFGCRS